MDRGQAARGPLTGGRPYNAELQRARAALRAGQAATAERLARELGKQRPDEPECVALLGAALLYQERVAESIVALQAALGAAPAPAPESLAIHVDLARALRAAGQFTESREHSRLVLAREPHHALAWLAYADALVDLQQYADARLAYERARLCDPEQPRVARATAALLADDRKGSEQLFREILHADPDHVAALCGLAALSLAADRGRDAERLLRHALRQSAYHPLIWRGLGQVLMSLGKLEEADAAVRRLLQIEPENPQSWITLAAVAVRLLRQEAALEAYEHAAQLSPAEVQLRMAIGHVQKTLGRRAQCEATYQAALRIDPGCAEAWWSLADLKNYSFSTADIAAMEAQLARTDTRRAAAAHLQFALGKAAEQRGQYPESFSHYQLGNALRRLDAPFDSGHFEQRCRRIGAFFNTGFFTRHAGCGDPDAAPIFIVGLPRSGSTLIEQILASHSQVEGTMELPNIINISHQFDDMVPSRDGYPETVATAPSGAFTTLGARYLAETAPLRSGRAHFTDKLPNNFSHVGLIHLMLPNATLIDARRHPMDACFSAYKQHFADGQTYSYDLVDLGRYYRAYLSLMDHWDAVLPGKVLRFDYEGLIADPETQIRRLLAHCRLPFEPACLAFHETRRAVRTASAEQVRQPLYASGVGYWRHFEKQLEPLRQALGDCLRRFD